MHTISTDRVERRHGGARPELKPGMGVTWADVIASGRPVRARQGTLFPRGRSADRQRSLLRRRRLAASGPMPPQLACHFTTGQLAALRIVSDEIRDRRRCTLYVDEIAARAGVSRRHAQGAIREAERLGLVHIQERRLTGTRNDTNVVTIISPEWLAWLAMGRGEDAKHRRARPSNFKSERPQTVERSGKRTFGIGIARFVPRGGP